jgi:HORMA domain-containing protein
MTTTLTQTFNRDDIRRVYASLTADYRIVAEWTELHSAAFVDETIEEIKALAEEQYLSAVHMQLQSSAGAIRQAAVYRVSTDASGWSADRPGDLYWTNYSGDRLQLIVYFSDKWRALSPVQRDAFAAVHMPGWGTSDFDGNYGSMSSSTDRHYSSRAYGMERTRYSS